MRKLLALMLSTLLLSSGYSLAATAQEVKKFEKPELGISFEYPDNWNQAPATPRGVLPSEVFNVRVEGDATTGFAVAVYRLDTEVTPDNLDATLRRLDGQARAWIARQPGGNVIEFTDISVDDVDGHEYSFEYTMGGQLMFSDMMIIPHGTMVFEISQWSIDELYDEKLEFFDEIFSSLMLPWSK